MPSGTLGLQFAAHVDGTALARPADRQFNGQKGDPEDHQEYQVDQDEGTSAVLTDHVRELPDVPETYRASCGDEDETQPAAQPLPLHDVRPE